MNACDDFLFGIDTRHPGILLVQDVLQLELQTLTSFLTLQDMLMLVCSDRSTTRVCEAIELQQTLRFVRNMLIRNRVVYSAEQWRVVRNDCEKAVIAEGWSADSWNLACWRSWKGGRFILPETFYQVWDALIQDEDMEMLYRSLEPAMQRSFQLGNIYCECDGIVGVLAYEIDIRHPTHDPQDDHHGQFFTHAMFVLRSKRIAIVGAYSTDDRTAPNNEWILYNIVVGVNVADALARAKDLVMMERDDAGSVGAGFHMPWELWHGRVIMYFADQDFRPGRCCKVPNPFRTTDVDRVDRTLLSFRQEWKEQRERFYARHTALEL